MTSPELSSLGALPPDFSALLRLSYPDITPDNTEAMLYAENALHIATNTMADADGKPRTASDIVRAAEMRGRRAAMAGCSALEVVDWHERAEQALAQFEANTGQLDNWARTEGLVLSAASLAIHARQTSYDKPGIENFVADRLADASYIARDQRFDMLSTSALRNQAAFEAIRTNGKAYKAAGLALLGMGNALVLRKGIGPNMPSRAIIRTREFSRNTMPLVLALTRAPGNPMAHGWRGKLADRLIR